MDFGLSEDQVLLKDTIRRYLDAECPTSRVREVMDSETGHDPALWKGLAEMGLTGLQIPTTHGGAGLELLDVALAAEELGWACTPGPFLATAMATAALLASDDAAAQKRWLPGIASGSVVATFALGEAMGEWDPERLKTAATGGALTGEKGIVPYAGIADLIVVAARDGNGPGLWCVERGAPKTTINRLSGTDMTRRVDAVSFAGTPATKLASGRGAIDRAVDAGLVLLAADAWGGTSRCVHLTNEYVLTREQFGQVIGAFQAVKHQLADLVTDVEPSLSLWWYAAHAYDHIRDQASRHAALAKAHMSDLYDRATRVCTELHGGIGFTWEFDMHLWFRRAVFDRAYLGDASYQRMRAAALAGW